eukprot:CAMPEP_0115736170 /NCGR_PEP_ID=MMETSP0272-20121206/87110_1 /TAXON_ID=71861 /ORGANISM="Scrippsiella trochoidea, Strain CCMP3099" /LENGTH=30 /DNA_ID= /DNA_START= /DNA_END= /DNA_ORIENTATION=
MAPHLALSIACEAGCAMDAANAQTVSELLV